MLAMVSQYKRRDMPVLTTKADDEFIKKYTQLLRAAQNDDDFRDIISKIFDEAYQEGYEKGYDE